MIFYHFTRFYNLKNVGPENILAYGLRAMPIEKSYSFLAGMHGVWLTTDGDMPWIFSSYAEVRIKLVIPSHDKKLIDFKKLLRKQLGPEAAAEIFRNIDYHSLPQKHGLTAEQFGGAAKLSKVPDTFALYRADIPLTSGYVNKIEYANPAQRAEAAKSLKPEYVRVIDDDESEQSGIEQ